MMKIQMRASDYIVNIGPGAGVHGGQVIAAGTPEEVMKNPNSITGKYICLVSIRYLYLKSVEKVMDYLLKSRVLKKII